MFDEPVFVFYYGATAGKFGETKNSLLKYVWYTEEIIHLGHTWKKHFI